MLGFSKKGAMTVTTKEGEDSQSLPSTREDPEQKLSFYQRHFCKPFTKDQENAHKAENRRFSLLSRGFILSIAVIVLCLITLLVAVLATQLDKRHQRAMIYKHPSPLREAILANFPDPAISNHNGTWYAFATNNAAGILKQPENSTSYDYGLSNVQIATSNNFVNWTVLGHGHDPLPEVGDWALQGLTAKFPQIPRANVWAPSILQRPSDGKFILYYSATAGNHSIFRHCVGAAIANDTASIAGPYIAANDTLACPYEEGGAIDPAAFIDHDNTIYVAYKVDGNAIGHGGMCGNMKAPMVDTPIRLQKMKSDGLTRDGDPTDILHRIEEDGPLVEAPSLVRSHEGKYFLFFSSGCTRNPNYNVKYAYADKITGPYTRARFPLLQTGDWGLRAPGSATVAATSKGGFEMAFHARVDTPMGGVRAMFTTQIQFNGTMVSMKPSLANS